MKKVTVISFAFLLFVGLFFANIPDLYAEEWHPDIKQLSIGAAPGGSWYLFAAKLSDLISHEFPGISTSVKTYGGRRNCIGVGDGELQLALSLGITDDAYNGTPPFKKAFKDIRIIGGLLEGVITLTCSNNVKSEDRTFAKLVGLRVSVGKKTYGTYAINQKLLRCWGIAEDHIRRSGGQVFYQSWPDAIAMMQDNKTDVILYPGGVPSALYFSLHHSPGFSLIPISKEKISKALVSPDLSDIIFPHTVSSNALFEGIPPKSYSTVAYMHSIICNKNLSEELVYRLTKLIYNQKQTALREASKLGKDALLAEFANRGTSVPLHPGAIRFYKEKGIEIH